MQVRGIHNVTPNIERIGGNFVGLGWDVMGNPSHIPGGHEELKAEFTRYTTENHYEAIQKGSAHGRNRKYAE